MENAGQNAVQLPENILPVEFENKMFKILLLVHWKLWVHSPSIIELGVNFKNDPNKFCEIWVFCKITVPLASNITE